MKSEEAAMIKKMEGQRAQEMADIQRMRMQEERRETVVLAHKKAFEVRQALDKEEAKEAKKVAALKSKLNALHSCEFLLGFQGTRMS